MQLPKVGRFSLGWGGVGHRERAGSPVEEGNRAELLVKVLGLAQFCTGKAINAARSTLVLARV